MGIGMVAKGRMGFRPPKAIKGRDDLRKILARAQELEAEA